VVLALAYKMGKSRKKVTAALSGTHQRFYFLHSTYSFSSSPTFPRIFSWMQ
jgi:hypothetical protein